MAKAFRPLVDDLVAEISGRGDGERPDVGGDREVARPKFMLWMTKSAVQPRDSVDEWEQMMGENDTVKQWAEEGKAESILRPGRVSLVDGNSGDYMFDSLFGLVFSTNISTLSFYRHYN